MKKPVPHKGCVSCYALREENERLKLEKKDGWSSSSRLKDYIHGLRAIVLGDIEQPDDITDSYQWFCEEIARQFNARKVDNSTAWACGYMAAQSKNPKDHINPYGEL